MFTARAAIEMTLGELRHWRIKARCKGCRRDSVIELQHLHRKYGDGPKVGRVIDRLKCEFCRAAPCAVLLTNTNLPNASWASVTLKDGRAQILIWDHEAGG